MKRSDVCPSCKKKLRYDPPSIFGIVADSVSGISDVTIVRESKNKLSISTIDQLSDNQIRDLYQIIYLMIKTGMNVREILEKSGVEYNE